jgi:hypothetical protein
VTNGCFQAALETEFSSHRSTFDLNQTQLSQRALTQTTFDSPFSKRLNLKSGAGLMKSQSLPVPASSKNKQSPPEPIREAGQALFLPEPGEHNEAQVVTRGQRKLSTGEGDAERETRIQAEHTGVDKGTCHTETSVHMDIDETESPDKGARKEEKPVVLDTTQAVWGRNKAASVSEKRAGSVPREHGGNSEEPATKKRRVELGDAQAEGSTSASKPTRKPPSKSGAGTTSLDSLRSRLAAFAKGGTMSSKQVPRTVDGGTEDEEGIRIKTSSKVAGKIREESPGFEVVRPSIKTSVLNMEERSAGNVGKTRVGSDGDSAMDDVAPSTSSTIEVPVRHSASKVVESDDEQDATSKTSAKRQGQRPEIIRGADTTSAMDDAAPSTSSTIEVPVRHSASKVVESDDEQDATSKTSAKRQGQRPEIIRGVDTTSGNVTLRFNLERLSSTWARPQKGQGLGAGDAPCISSKVPADAGVANMEDNESATRALARVIEKADFANMDIIGQFNLGFIVVRRQKTTSDEGVERGQMDDLFIVDQHASDEKYNFETLQQTTRIQSQKLFRCVFVARFRRY